MNLVVFEVPKPVHCAECRQGPLPMLVREDGVPRCLDCADLGHLVYLPRGNAALTRRAREGSSLYAVVVRYAKRRRRHERQGLLVEEEALARAEVRCLADAEARARRRARDQVRRTAADVRFTAAFAAEIQRLFPGIPPERALAVAAHASARGSGRVGRTAAGRALDAYAVSVAVRASVRHEDTDYDAMLMAGVPRFRARARLAPRIEAILTAWQHPDAAGRRSGRRPDRDPGAGRAGAGPEADGSRPGPGGYRSADGRKRR